MKTKVLSRGNTCRIFDTFSVKGGSMPFFRKSNKNFLHKGGPLA
ncbi:MAG TPA: hypothetical protein VFH42_03610 [Sporolactobacillaceae bacterium]|nr:hypothetical protein [Sporolactobacillaceae bacterium]